MLWFITLFDQFCKLGPSPFLVLVIASITAGILVFRTYKLRCEGNHSSKMPLRELTCKNHKRKVSEPKREKMGEETAHFDLMLPSSLQYITNDLLSSDRT